MPGLHTLTIGGLSVAFQIEDDAPCAWDTAHRVFLSSGTAPTPAATLDVRSGIAPARGNFIQTLADSGLWQLRRDPVTGYCRIAIHGCPQGALNMTLDLAPDFCGTLFLGTPPPGHAHVPLGYPLTPLLWTLLLGAADGLLCHACGVITPSGDGLLFAGFSGDGKSTTSRLWRESCPAVTILSDDRIILRRDSHSPTKFTIHGTPWHGDAEEASPRSAPLRQIFFLGRSPDGETNVLTPLPPALAAAQLLARATPPIWDAIGMASALELAGAACQSIPAARWDFTSTPQAVDELLSHEEAFSHA